jgi:acid phosphatase type 7
MRPAPGNHEYETLNAAGYFEYFGDAAGPAGRGYYSFDLGSWHIVSLNSNCLYAGCAAGSPQERWLREHLATHPARCTLAYWHHPRFSSTTSESSRVELQPIWQALYDSGADVVLSAHEHNYERFAPQTPAGERDAARGIRQFIVGTGGRSHDREFEAISANSEVRNGNSYGVLRLVLRRNGYSWKFIPAAGSRFSDSGSARCHG